MKAPFPTRPEGPKRAGLLDAEGELLLEIPGHPLRSVGKLRRLTLTAAAVWLAVVAAGLVVGWMLRGLA
mgnify:CR=1 FL=1